MHYIVKIGTRGVEYADDPIGGYIPVAVPYGTSPRQTSHMILTEVRDYLRKRGITPPPARLGMTGESTRYWTMQFIEIWAERTPDEVGL